MVGVPGRSQSCVTCLGRKKGCDKQRPGCSQCAKAGLPCGGYDRARIFVNRTQVAGESSTAYSAHAGYVSQRSNAASSTEDIALPFSLAQTAYNLRYVDLFWTAYLPGGKAFNADAAKLSNGSWVTIAVDLLPTDRSLQLAMQGVALRGLGTQNGDRTLVKQGVEAYTKCLQEFNKALYDPKRLRLDGVLCTSRLLALFEMHYGADDTDHQVQCRSWIAHANGQLAILSARHPREFRSGKAHQLFTDFRYILIISAIRDRKRFFLNSKGWKTIPWKSHHKSPHDKLLDILGDLAGVLEDIDSMANCEDDREEHVVKQRITRSCWGLDDQLQSWTRQVGSLKNFQNTDDTLGPKDPEDFALAHLTILYWAICVLLYANLVAFADSMTDLPPRMDPPAYARELVRALPFFFQPSAGIMGPKMAAFPLGLALQVLCGTESTPSQHRCKLGVFLNEINETGAETKAMFKFLMSLQRESGRSGGLIGNGIQSVEARAKSWMNLRVSQITPK